MIKSFKHRGLKELQQKGSTSKVRQDMVTKCLMILDALDRAIDLKEMNIPGLKFHKLKGKPVTFALKVTGNWRITFEWIKNEPHKVDLKDYH